VREWPFVSHIPSGHLRWYFCMDGWCLAATARYSMNIGSFESCRTSSIYKLFRSSIYRNGVHSGSFPRQPKPTLYHASPLQSPQVARLESKIKM
jgi:hypothetical protein